MYETILVPLDGSDESRAALRFATALPANHYRLLRVDDDRNSAVDLAIAPSSGERVESKDRLTAQLREAAGTVHLPEGKVDFLVRFGEPAEVIIEEGATADLIVMTTHGRGAAGRALFGSTADRVTRHGHTPTVLLRAREGGASTQVVSRVVVALDGSPLAELALPVATRLARALGAPTHLVRVVDPVAILAKSGYGNAAIAVSTLVADAYEATREALEREASDYLDEQASTLGGGDVTTEVRTGTPSFALLDSVKPDDVLVLTSHGRGGVRRWMIGSVAEKLVREADSPVLLVPARNGAQA